ncbi:MAG: diguanylate cyclase [Limnoraphis robusta]
MIENRQQELILIVDDNPTNIKVLSDFLKDFGFKVLIAKDGESCLSKLEKIIPDLILLDVMMPGVDGFETCRRLKALEATKDIPVIFMTALTDPVDKLKGFTLGAVDYITKPLQHEEAIARVNVHLKLRCLTKQLERQNHLLEEKNQLLQEEIRYRKLAESAFRLSEEKFSKAFRCSPHPLTISTLAEGRYIEVNESFCRLTGYSFDELIGKTADELDFWVNSDDRQRVVQQLQSEGTIRNQEFNYRTKLGTIRTVLLSAEIFEYDGQDYLLAIPNDITDRKQAKAVVQRATQELKRITTIDDLTQIANRRRFEEYLGQQWGKLGREQAPLSFILCDVDYFKHYNDTYGYEAGNDCLQLIAQTLLQITRTPADLVARYGGEEFAVVLPHTNSLEASQVAEAICSSIQQLKIPHNQSNVSQFVTLSLGVSSVVPSSESCPAEALMTVAIRALSQAKQRGRDTYYLHSEPQSA